MKKLAFVLAAVILAAGCATTGIEGRAHAPLLSQAPSTPGALSTDGAPAGAAIQAVREHADLAAALAMSPGLSSMTVEPSSQAVDRSRQPEKASLSLKDKIAPMLKKGIPDGRDENTFTGGIAAAPSDNKTSSPKVKGGQGNITERLKKAMLTVQLLLRRGKGGEANEGFSNASIQRVKNVVNDATADQGKGRPNAQDSLKRGITEVNLLMKKGKGCVADEGFSGDSIRSVERQLSSGSKADTGKDSIKDRVLQYTRRSVSGDCGTSRCRD